MFLIIKSISENEIFKVNTFEILDEQKHIYHSLKIYVKMWAVHEIDYLIESKRDHHILESFKIINNLISVF